MMSKAEFIAKWIPKFSQDEAERLHFIEDVESLWDAAFDESLWDAAFDEEVERIIEE